MPFAGSLWHKSRPSLYLEVELEPTVVSAGVQVALGVTAVVQAGAALAVTEQEGALEGTSDWLGVLPENISDKYLEIFRT